MKVEINTWYEGEFDDNDDLINFFLYVIDVRENTIDYIYINHCNATGITNPHKYKIGFSKDSFKKEDHEHFFKEISHSEVPKVVIKELPPTIIAKHRMKNEI